jgi:hypothetical protein
MNREVDRGSESTGWVFPLAWINKIKKLYINCQAHTAHRAGLCTSVMTFLPLKAPLAVGIHKVEAQLLPFGIWFGESHPSSTSPAVGLPLHSPMPFHHSTNVSGTSTISYELYPAGAGDIVVNSTTWI